MDGESGERKNMSGGTLAFGLLGAFALGQQVRMRFCPLMVATPKLRRFAPQTSHIPKRYTQSALGRLK